MQRREIFVTVFVIAVAATAGCASPDSSSPQSNVAATPFSMESPPLVDIHGHLMHASLDRYMKILDQVGFRRSIMLGPCRNLLGAESKYPGRLFLFTHGLRDFKRWREQDPSYLAQVPGHVEQDLKAGCRGLGEFYTRHMGIPGIGMAPINVPGDSPAVLKIIDIVARFDRPIFWHFEARFVHEYERATAHNPAVKIVWVHAAIGDAGFQRLRKALQRFPNLYLDLSGSGSQTFHRLLFPDAPGRPPHLLPDRRTIHPLWRELVEEFADRIMIPGLDLESAGHQGLEQAAAITADYRNILSQLSPCAARKAGYETAERLLGLITTPPAPCPPLDPASVVFPLDVFKLDNVVLDQPLPARLRGGQKLTITGTTTAAGPVKACLFTPGVGRCDLASAEATAVNGRFSLVLDLARVQPGDRQQFRITPDFSSVGRAVVVNIE